MSDPYLAGDDEPHYEWRAPRSPDCPACACCTARLCAAATERGGVCGHHGTVSDFDLFACPCSAGNTFAGMRAAAAGGQQGGVM